jgi:hypothetical protein
MDQHRPASGITAIFDSKRPAVRGANYVLHVASFALREGMRSRSSRLDTGRR